MHCPQHAGLRLSDAELLVLSEKEGGGGGGGGWRL